MIYSHALSPFLLYHLLNGLGNANLRSMQEAMRASEPATEKYKNVCEEFPNLGILTKISTPGEVQLMFGYATVGNKSLDESIQVFALAGNLGSPSIISFNLEIAFAPEGKNIRLPITEVLLCATAGDLTHSKKQRDWQSLNAVLLPPFLTEAAILHGESDAGELLKIFARAITEWASDTAPPSEADEAGNDDSVVTVEATEASEGKKLGKPKASADTPATEARKPGKAKQASAETAAAKTLASFAVDCDDVLAFLQAVAVKYPQVISAPLSLRADK